MFEEVRETTLANRGKSRSLNVGDDDTTDSSTQQGQTCTPEEVAQFQAMLMSDNPMVASNAVSFFSNSISSITPEILKRVLDLGMSGDPDLAQDATSLISEAVKSSQIPIEEFLRINVADYFIQIITKYSSDPAVVSLALHALRVFAKRSPELLLRITTDDNARALYFTIFDSSAQDPRVAAEVLGMWNLWFNSRFAESHRNLEFECECGRRILSLLGASNEVLQLLALNSLRFFCSNCSEESVKNLLSEGLFDRLTALAATGPKAMTSCLLAIHPMTGASDEITSVFAGFISDVLVNDIVTRLSDPGVLALTAILANFAASNDARLIGVVLSEPALAFLDFVTGQKQFTIQQKALDVFCFLAISTPDVFLGLLQEHPLWLQAIMSVVDNTDTYHICASIECLVSLARYAESKGEAVFRQFVDFIIENEPFVTSVQDLANDYGSSLASVAEALLNYLNR